MKAVGAKSVSKQTRKELNKTVVPHASRLFTVKEAARVLRISDRSMRRLIDDRELAHYRVGRRVVVSQESIDDYLSRHHVPAIDAKEIARKILEGRINI